MCKFGDARLFHHRRFALERVDLTHHGVDHCGLGALLLELLETGDDLAHALARDVPKLVDEMRRWFGARHGHVGGGAAPARDSAGSWYERSAFADVCW